MSILRPVVHSLPVWILDFEDDAVDACSKNIPCSSRLGFVDVLQKEVLMMKKFLIAMAICAGMCAFANTSFAEAADQQTAEAVSLAPSTSVDTQQMSTKTREDDC